MAFYGDHQLHDREPDASIYHELSFSARVVVIILIAATTLFVIALNEPAVITALVEMARAFAP
jgi:hypothetical protein